MGDYTPIGAYQQDITFLERIRDSTETALDNNIADCLTSIKRCVRVHA